MTQHPTESQTRETLIDPALRKAGWDVDNPDQVRAEIPVDGFDPAAWKALDAKLNHLKEAGVPYDVKLPKGICDYALYRPNGEIIAVVEAKRTSVDSRLAEPQVEFYVTEIAKRQSFRPFGFATNGHDIYFHDVGRAPKRQVYGFFSPDDLENLLYLRQNQKPFAAKPPDLYIADRPYQLEAIRRVCEAFERGRRKTLLVMATGTGKTRTAMSLVDVFLRTNQARHIVHKFERLRVQQRESARQASICSSRCCSGRFVGSQACRREQTALEGLPSIGCLRRGGFPWGLLTEEGGDESYHHLLVKNWKHRKGGPRDQQRPGSGWRPSLAQEDGGSRGR